MDSNQNNQTNKNPKLPALMTGMIILVVALAGIAIYLGINKSSKSSTTAITNNESVGQAEKSANPVGSLTLDPTQGELQQNKTVTIGIYEDSKDQPVNAVQANLTYPADKFEFVNIDATDSTFNVAAEGSGSNGVIRIGRGIVGSGTASSLTGKKLVAKVNLKVIASNGQGEIKFSPDSDVISSVDNKSMLSSNSSSSAIFSLKTE